MTDEYNPGDLFDCETYEEMVKIELEEMKSFNRSPQKKRVKFNSLERNMSDYEMDIYL